MIGKTLKHGVNKIINAGPSTNKIMKTEVNTRLFKDAYLQFFV